MDRPQRSPDRSGHLGPSPAASAVGDIDYGTEWDASAGFKVGKIGLLFKYADYDAKDFGIDTRKFWLQAEWAF